MTTSEALRRYDVRVHGPDADHQVPYLCIEAHVRGALVKWVDVSARLQQLEESEQAAARVRDAAVKRCEMLDTAEKANESLRTQVQQLEQEKATLLKDMSKLACSYCDNVIEFDSPEARWTDEGRARAFDHMLECPNRPELKLVERIETLSAALAETRDALHQLTEKYDELEKAARGDGR